MWLSHGLLSPSVRSKSSSCPIKLKLGEMLDFFLLMLLVSSTLYHNKIPFFFQKMDPLNEEKRHFEVIF